MGVCKRKNVYGKGSYLEKDKWLGLGLGLGQDNSYYDLGKHVLTLEFIFCLLIALNCNQFHISNLTYEIHMKLSNDHLNDSFFLCISLIEPCIIRSLNCM